MTGEMPPGWTRIAIGKLTKPTRPRRNPQEYSQLPFVGMEQVEPHTRRLLGILSSSEMKSTAFHFQPGDVLYGRLRPYLNKVLCADFEGLCSSEFIVLPPTDSLDPKYLAYYLSNDEFVAFANQLNQGDRPRVSFDQIGEHEIPLPPIAEQCRIVAKMEKLLCEVDACQHRLEKIPTLLSQFRQAVLASACTGDLTASWRKKNGVLEEFERTTIDAIGEYLGGFAYKSPTFLEAGKHQVIRIGNVRPLALKLGASPVFIPDKIAHETERFKLQTDDLVISMTGTKYRRDYGCAGIVREDDGSLYLNQRVARIRCRKAVLPKFLLFWLQTNLFRDFFFAGETGNVNQGNVGASGIRNAPIDLPSLSEQQEIVRRVNGLFALADRLESRFADGRKRVNSITQAVIAKAFCGELVPTESELAKADGRSFESAEELLDRTRQNGHVEERKQKLKQPFAAKSRRRLK